MDDSVTRCKIFDLEQDIMYAWAILDDLRWAQANDMTPAMVKTITDYYDHKFERLWTTFEATCKEYWENHHAAQG